MVKSKTLMKEGTVKPLPPHIRKRLTLQGALMSDPRRYMNSLRFEHSPSRRPRPKKKSPPKPVVDDEETQTLNVSDAETNTKIARFSNMQCATRRLKKARSAVSKTRGARGRSRSTTEQLTTELRGILKPEGGILINTSSISSQRRDDVKKPVLPQGGREPSGLPRTDPPGVRRHRGILKKPVHDVVADGMCSQGTATESKRPHLSRILKENHIFMKYSNNCKPKKKRVRVDKKPVFSYLSKKTLEKESVLSLGASKEERPRRVELAEDVKYMSDASADSSDSLERKPACCVLEWTPPQNAEKKPTRCVLKRVRLPEETSNVNAEPGSASGVSLVVYHVSSAPQLSALGKPPLLPPPAPAHPQVPPKTAPKNPKIPKERLYFKNMFFRFPASKR